jgi:hypothetical protein
VTKTGISETPISFDQTVGKLIALEVKQCRVELQRLADRLAVYEQQYQMASDNSISDFGEANWAMIWIWWNGASSGTCARPLKSS